MPGPRPDRSGAPRSAASGREDHWRDVLRRWRGSGLTQAAFCRRHGVPLGSFQGWKWQLAIRDERRRSGPRRDRVRRPPTRPASPPLFYPVRVVDSRSWAPAPLEVVLGTGRVLRVRADFDPAVLSKLVSTLEAPSC